MRTLTILIALVTFCNLQAQESNSLQASFNKALAKETPINNLQANLDISKNTVQIKWESNPAIKVNAYVIQKSADKLSWNTVAEIYGAPHKNTATSYFYTDYQPIENVSYYRVVEKTQAKEELTSNVVPVNYVKKDGTTAGMNLNPDFSEGQKIINIAFEDVFEKEILIVMRDKKGNEYYSKVIFNIEDEKLVAVPIKKEIPKGDYLITATSENQIYSQNIVIK